MSHKPPPLFPATGHVAGTTDKIALGRILEPGINLALWYRGPSPLIVGELGTLDASSFPDVRVPTTPTSRVQDVATLFQGQGFDTHRYPHWVEDIHELVGVFHELAGPRPVTLRLETTDGDGCRRFHVDRTHLRLLCTYRGPGTEWLRNAQVDRHAQAHFKPNEDILRHGVPACFEPFWVGVMKGELFPGNAGNALVHRSPP